MSGSPYTKRPKSPKPKSYKDYKKEAIDNGQYKKEDFEGSQFGLGSYEFKVRGSSKMPKDHFYD